MFDHFQSLTNFQSLNDENKSVRVKGKYAPEAYSLGLVHRVSFPEATYTSGVTASHLNILYMLEVELNAASHNVSLIGNCADSASNF